jgi:hypothetical protein
LFTAKNERGLCEEGMIEERKSERIQRVFQEKKKTLPLALNLYHY